MTQTKQGDATLQVETSAIKGELSINAQSASSYASTRASGTDSHDGDPLRGWLNRVHLLLRVGKVSVFAPNRTFILIAACAFIAPMGAVLAFKLPWPIAVAGAGLSLVIISREMLRIRSK